MVETRAGSKAKRADEPASQGGDTDDDGVVDDDDDGAALVARVPGPPADIRPTFGLRAVGEGDSAARPMRSSRLSDTPSRMRSSTMPSLRCSFTAESPGHLASAATSAPTRACPRAAQRLIPRSRSHGRAARDPPALVEPTARARTAVEKVPELGDPAMLRRIEDVFNATATQSFLS